MISTHQIGGENPPAGRFWESARVVRIVAAALFLAIAALDLSLPNVNLTALFAVPLLLFISRTSRTEHVWRYVAFFVVAVYALYVAKYAFIHGRDVDWLFNYRLFNRTFVALSLALLGIIAQAWFYWQHERSLLTYLDKSEEDEVNATAGLVGCIGLAFLITAIDFVSPANFNLPILYAVPLFLVSWLRNQRALWITVAVLIGLTWIGFVTTPATESGLDFYFMVNRTLVSFALVLMGGILNWNLRRNNERDASKLDSGS